VATSRNKVGHEGDGAAKVMEGDNRGDDAGWKHWKHNCWLSSCLSMEGIRRGLAFSGCLAMSGIGSAKRRVYDAQTKAVIRGRGRLTKPSLNNMAVCKED
jgi:hypothetical protein